MDADVHLIMQARKLITGANVHIIRTWIFCYETSKPDSARQARYEALLRDFVVSRSLLNSMKRRLEAQRDYVAALSIAQNRINRRLEKLLVSSSD